MSDSVSVFAEGTFEEQVQELAEYISRTRPESERATFTNTFEEALKTGEGQTPLEEDLGRRQRVISQVVDSIDGLGEGSDKEIEGFFNLVSSHILALYAADSPEFSAGVSKITDVVSSSSHEQASVKYRVLTNFFNAIPRTSPARLTVCNALLRLAKDNDELDTLHLTPTDVKRWLDEWNVSSEEKCQLLKAVADAFAETGNFDAAYTFKVSYVQSLPLSSSAESSALDLIALALRLTGVFNFDLVLKLENVQAQKSHPLFGLLTIVNEQGLDELSAWVGKNGSILKNYQLEVSSLERKVRLLTLSELAFPKIGQNIPYAEIASALQIQTADVEKWVIDVIRAGLLSGKLSQVSQTLLVVRASPRGFAAEQWKTLEERLLAWKEGLAGIQSVLNATGQSGAGMLANSLGPQEQAA